MAKPTKPTEPAKEIRTVADLIPDDKNANHGTPFGRGMLESSLRELGAGRSVLADRKGRIIGGNKTVEVAGEIGLNEVIVVPSDGKKLVVVQRTDIDLDSREGRRLAIADNRVNEVGLEWDGDVLSDLVDNSTRSEKLWLRRQVRRTIDHPPVVLETHGGLGAVWEASWADCPSGAVIEKDAGRAVHLADQRPTWAVYQADATMGLAGGLGAHLSVEVLDVDPYGDPWPTIAAFFQSRRPFAPAMHVVVNDGLRQRARRGLSWSTPTLKPVVQRYGNRLYPVYLEVCRELMAAAVKPAGYTLASFKGYYCGKAQNMTHYWASLSRAAV